MLCTIYVIKNSINDKVYVGQTWQTLERRISSGYKPCIHLSRAMNKYGADKFHHEVLTFSATQETADQLEQHFIAKFDSIKNGYNIRSGVSRGKHSEESKKKISETRKLRKIPSPTFTGHNHSDISKKKTSNSMKESCKNRIRNSKGHFIKEIV